MIARRTKILFAVLVSLLITGERSRSISSAEDLRTAKRIRFQLATVEEGAGGRKVISKATVEGPPGTDFVVDLQSKRFKMNARFVTDLIAPGELKVRAKLDTRRLYGYSQNSLALYEEDSQSEALQLGFDEQIVLLPFGKGSGDLLKIEVTPELSDQPAYLSSGEMQPPSIYISEPSPGGMIVIHAMKIPHQFDVEALLLEDGREVARSSAPFSIEESGEILLQPNDRASADIRNIPLAINLTIGGYERNSPRGEAAINFDIHRIDTKDNSARKPVALGWAGIAVLDSAVDYDLRDPYPKSGHKYQLRFRIKLASR